VRDTVPVPVPVLEDSLKDWCTAPHSGQHHLGKEYKSGMLATFENSAIKLWLLDYSSYSTSTTASTGCCTSSSAKTCTEAVSSSDYPPVIRRLTVDKSPSTSSSGQEGAEVVQAAGLNNPSLCQLMDTIPLDGCIWGIGRCEFNCDGSRIVFDHGQHHKLAYLQLGSKEVISLTGYAVRASKDRFCVSRTSNKVVSSTMFNDDNAMLVWDLDHGVEPVRRLYLGPFYAAGLSTDESLLVGYLQCALKVWRIPVDSAAETTVFDGSMRFALSNQCCFSFNGDKLAIASEVSICIRNTEDWEISCSWNQPATKYNNPGLDYFDAEDCHSFSSLQFSLDGSLLLASHIGNVFVWDSHKGTLLVNLSIPDDALTDGAYFLGDGAAFTLMEHGRLKVYDSATGTFLSGSELHRSKQGALLCVHQSMNILL
jgi:hypothetical protein